MNKKKKYLFGRDVMCKSNQKYMIPLYGTPSKYYIYALVFTKCTQLS